MEGQREVRRGDCTVLFQIGFRFQRMYFYFVLNILYILLLHLCEIIFIVYLVFEL